MQPNKGMKKDLLLFSITVALNVKSNMKASQVRRLRAGFFRKRLAPWLKLARGRTVDVEKAFLSTAYDVLSKPFDCSGCWEAVEIRSPNWGEKINNFDFSFPPFASPTPIQNFESRHIFNVLFFFGKWADPPLRLYHFSGSWPAVHRLENLYSREVGSHIGQKRISRCYTTWSPQELRYSKGI